MNHSHICRVSLSKFLSKLTKIRKIKRKPLEATILVTSERFSNNLKDAVRTICQVCQASVTLLTMRSHTRNKHNMDIKEYRNVFGDPKNQMVEVVKHRCGICSEELLLHCDVISPHVKKHKITHSEYTKKYMVLINNKKPKITQFNVLKSLDDNYNAYSEEEMIAEMQAILDRQI